MHDSNAVPPDVPVGRKSHAHATKTTKTNHTHAHAHAAAHMKRSLKPSKSPEISSSPSRSAPSPPATTGSSNALGYSLSVCAIGVLVLVATVGLRRLADAPRWVHGVVCSGGVFASFILHDFLQELITKTTEGRIPLGMTAFEFLACAFCPAVELLVSGRPLFATGKLAPCWAFWSISAFLLASLALGNIALKFVSYPVKVVLKSSKLLPAMLMGKVILGKKYLAFQYVAAVSLCAGVVGCSYADKYVEGGKPSSALGVCLLLVAVCCDAVSPVVQEQMLGQHSVHAAELMLRTNLIALGGILSVWVASGEYASFPALQGGGDDPTFLIISLCTYGMTSFVGVTFMLALIEAHGSAVGVAVGTLRKVVTVLLSFLWWGKAFSLTFAVSGLAVLAAIALNSQAKRLDAALCPAAR